MVFFVLDDEFFFLLLAHKLITHLLSTVGLQGIEP